MYITATQIAEWAKTKEAQAALPRLLRRLVHAGGGINRAAFPAGDSTGLPGWDGELQSEHGNTWIPKGHSCWEFSCHSKVTWKANQDYGKRTRQTTRKIRAKATLIVVSSRKWLTKSKWLQEKARAGKWRKVRAYDAVDLEQWLEQSPAVTLQFAEELGLIGQGVESVEKHWRDWSQQSHPPITSEAFFIDRQSTRDRLLTDLCRQFESGQPELYRIKADSVHEAAGFVCAALIMRPQLSAASLVVTEPSGWNYVERNLALKVAIAACPEVAERKWGQRKKMGSGMSIDFIPREFKN